MSFSKVSHCSPKLWSKGVFCLKQPLICLTLSLSLVASGFSAPSASAAKAPVFKDLEQISVANLRSLFADGVYLYGQSPEPEQIGSAYLIFEVRNRQTVGAFYLPSSSFDCFHGELQPDRLFLTIVDSYNQSTYPYAVALQAEQSVAGLGVGAAPPVSLVGYHPIESISAVDYQLLSTCQANYQQQFELSIVKSDK